MIDALEFFETWGDNSFQLPVITEQDDFNLNHELPDHAQVLLQSNLRLADPRGYFHIARQFSSVQCLLSHWREAVA
jgi:hypothetical protein